LDLALGDNHLLPEHGVLGQQRGMRPKQICNQPATNRKKSSIRRS
jgi:hypothetical protein